MFVCFTVRPQHCTLYTPTNHDIIVHIERMSLYFHLCNLFARLTIDNEFDLHRHFRLSKIIVTIDCLHVLKCSPVSKRYSDVFIHDHLTMNKRFKVQS